MRSMPYNFARSKNRQSFTIFDLILVEVGVAYTTEVSGINTEKTRVKISEQLAQKFTDDGFVPYGQINGEVYVATFESGKNVGTYRAITNYLTIGDDNYLEFGIPLVYSSALSSDSDYAKEKDVLRISKNLALTSNQDSVSFFLPDNSNTTQDHSLVYVPFPFSIEPLGTSITGEILNIKAEISNANKFLGNLIQDANGLRGNRVVYIRTFDDVYEYGRNFCLKDVLYVDTVSISNTTVDFGLEGKFNIIGLNLPNGKYLRNFCRHTFKDERCAWTEDVGLDPDYIYANKINGTNTNGYISCDHTLMGPNGCTAHKNTRRYGGFPSIPAK